jgi:hypothetical protein
LYIEIKATLRQVRGVKTIDTEVSDYYLVNRFVPVDFILVFRRESPIHDTADV